MGKALYEHLKGQVPLGLIKRAVGGTPIEYWIPPGVAGSCHASASPCPKMIKQSGYSSLFNAHIRPLQPYTVGAMVWDQAERDDKTSCPKALRTYPCLEAALVRSWRLGFQSASVPFVAVQLPGYASN